MFHFHESPQRRHVLISICASSALFATSMGVSLNLIRKETGVDPIVLMESDSYLPENFLNKLFALLSKACPGRNVALELVQAAILFRLRVETSEPISRLALHSGNVQLIGINSVANIYSNCGLPELRIIAQHGF